MASIYDFVLTDIDGNEIRLSDYKGKVIMIVNTATGCGFTPQYEPIENMYAELHDQGFEVLDIPCNQFGGQAPGTDQEIHDFCTIHFATEFPQMTKSDVNGENELPLYTYLKAQKGFEGFGDSEMAGFMKDFLSKMDPEYDKTTQDGDAYKNVAEGTWTFDITMPDQEEAAVAIVIQLEKMIETRSENRN